MIGTARTQRVPGDAADVDVLVVGGGISGLATAWWLQREGITVELWERDARPGGKIRTDAAGGYVSERAAALMMNFRPEVTQLLAESGLDAAKAPRSAGAARRYLVEQGRLVAVPTAMGAMLGSPLWSARGRLRVLLEPFVPRGGHAGETVSEFVSRRLGRELLEKAMEPFIAGPLASDPDRAEARATLPRLKALEQRYGSIAAGVLVHKLLGRRTAHPTETFSFEGGMATLIRVLAATPGVRLRAGRAATGLEPRASTWRVTGCGAQGECAVSARHVVLGVPASAAAQLLVPVDRELAGLLRGIEYAPLVVVHLGLPRPAIEHPLDGAGFLVPRREGLPLNGNLWMSSLFPGRAPEGYALLTSYLGGARRPQAFDWDEERAISTVLATLKPLLNIGGTPAIARIHRHRYALPLYHGDYLGRLAAIDARLSPLPGLHLVANYRGGVSVRDRIACGRAAAGSIATALGKRPSATVDAQSSPALGAATA
ncbi:MAG: protoporphyrinogen oxidase [Betaproteobacteria bacterium RIFCSPLOWO2_12_FULL_62_13]|nr:MAG: protoporphyrinogen oxidase [Betaproteobacteria bacterium RIFCSPLOWO2_12_FULL_62_13]